MKREDRAKYPAYAFPGIKSACRFLICAILFLAGCLLAQAQQTYPVQVYTQLVPPYTPHIPAYYTGTQAKLKVMLINTDMQQPTVNVYLRMKILSSSFSAVTPPEVYTPQIELQAGMPVTLSLNDLEPYFKKENLRVSGGQSEFYRTQMLPDNFYRFHFEVYEAGTNRLVSNTKTGFAQAMIASGEPPVLNLPQKGTVIKESNIPSILFSWTPRHMNSIAAAYGTEYDISLVEIYDKQVAPEAAFDYSRVLYTETTKSTSFIHTAAQPLLIPGMRYAWRVQAKAREGVDEISVFKNNGYSPISWFDYTADCKTVQSCGAIYENGHVDISWQDVGAMEYTVEYRKKGTGRWYTGTINKPLLSQLYNLQAGKDYEYRIGSRCVAGDTFLYNNPQAFHIPDRQENGPDCGLMPDISLTNRTPARELQSGMPVLVGDFPVFITKVSGSGRFTGEGYVGIPYLQGTQIAVTFKDIVVNTDNRLVEGFFETKYDTKNNNLLLDADEYQTGGKGVGDIRSGEEQAAFKVDYTINPDIKALPLKADGTKDDITEGTDYTISKGENGKYTFVLTDSEGKEHKVEADTMPATIEDKEGNTYEVNEKGEVKAVSKVSDIKLDNSTKDTQSKLAALSFRVTGNTKYALDEYRAVYEKVTEYNDQYKPEGTAITASAKFMLPGVSDEIAVYIKENKENKLLPEKVRFITGKGKEYSAVYDNQTKGWTLTIVGGQANDGQELYAVQDTGDGKYETLGKLNIFTYEPLERKVTLVPVNGAMNNLDKQTVQNGLNEIYGKVGIHWTVNVLDQLPETKEPFKYTPKNGSTFNVTGSGLLSMFTDDMKAINEAFKASEEYQEDGLYLFVIGDKAGESGTEGDMPLGSQFGYLFPGAAIRTIAHEVGHGAFNLEHPFDRPGRNSFPQKGMLEYNLMDYPTKDAEKWTELVKIQWDATRVPGHVIGLFQKDKSGMAVKDDDYQYIIEHAARSIGAQIGVDVYAILHSQTCAKIKSSAKIVHKPGDFPQFSANGILYAETLLDEDKNRFSTVLLVKITESKDKTLTSVNVEKYDGLKLSRNTSFLGIITKDSVYSCNPSEQLSCEALDNYVDKKDYQAYIANIFIDIDNCFKYNKPNGQSGNVGQAFLFTVMTESTSASQKEGLEKIAVKYNEIANLLFNNQERGNEWNEFGEYFMASFKDYESSSVDEEEYLKRLDEFIANYEQKKSKLTGFDSRDKMVLFISTFNDNEIKNLPMALRLNAMDKLSRSNFSAAVSDFIEGVPSIPESGRENTILRLMKNIPRGEESSLLTGLREGELLKLVNNEFQDFLTIIGNNYPEFIRIINGYMYEAKGITKDKYLDWMNRLSDDKSFNIGEEGKKEFISATSVMNNGKVIITLSRSTGKTMVVQTGQGTAGSTAVVTIYDSRKIEMDYDEPVALYHNIHRKGIESGLLGSVEIVPALQLHYYLQTSRDQALADAGWFVVDVASLFAGVGEISAGVKGIRLGLAVLNVTSSATSLIANAGESYFINNVDGGQSYLDALHYISAVTGFVDLGVNGISALKKACSKELVEIGAFYRKDGDEMLSSSDENVRRLGEYTREMYEGFDADLLRQVDNAVEGGSQTGTLINKIKSYGYLQNKFDGMSDALKTRFLDDFADASDDVLRALNKQNSEIMEGWIKFRNKYPDRKICM